MTEYAVQYRYVSWAKGRWVTLPPWRSRSDAEVQASAMSGPTRIGRRLVRRETRVVEAESVVDSAAQSG